MRAELHHESSIFELEPTTNMATSSKLKSYMYLYMCM